MRRSLQGKDGTTKLAVVRAAVGHSFPTTDIDRMLAEIERGYLESTPAPPPRLGRQR